MLRHHIESRRSHLVRVYGEGGIAEVPQQNSSGQYSEVCRQLAGMPAMLHEVRSGRRHVHNAGVQAHRLPDLPRELSDHRDYRVTHRYCVPTVRRTDAPVRHSTAAQDTSQCDIEIRRLYGASRASIGSGFALVPSTGLQLCRDRFRVCLVPETSLRTSRL